jgi:hypothetical protein
MTAKKYVENATADRLVVFQRDIFKDFLDQYSKEQRENCAEEIVSAGVSVIKKKVLEAKQPEV